MTMTNNYTIFKLSKSQQWLFGLAITVGFFAANFSDGILLYFRPIEGFTKSLLIRTGSSRIFGTILLAAIYGTIAYLGIIDFRKNGMNRKNTITIAIGIISCIAMLVLQTYSFKITHDMNNYIINSQTELINGIKNKLQTDLPSDRLSKLDLLYAKIRYEVYGSINEYKLPDGSLAKYEPDEESKKTRHLLMMLTYIQKRESSMKATVIILWLLTPIVALLFGLYYPTNRSTRQAG